MSVRELEEVRDLQRGRLCCMSHEISRAEFLHRSVTIFTRHRGRARQCSEGRDTPVS